MNGMANARAFSLETGWTTVLRDLELEPREVLRRAELPEDLFVREGARLSSAEYFRLWSALEDSLEDPTFPLLLAEAVQAESFHPAVFAAMCCSNFGQAALRLSEHKRLLAPVRLHVEADTHDLTLRFEWLDRSTDPPSSLELTELAFLLKLARLATRTPITATSVCVPSPPEPARAFTEFFGTSVQRAPEPTLAMSLVDARRPFLTANEGMWNAFAPELRRRLAELDASASCTERVRSALLEALPGGESSIEQVSKRLGISKRSLQRRLRDDGNTFQHVLNATREELARHYLAKTSLSGTEISYMLGFADPNSFFRAFQSWTGETTEQVRASMH